MKRPLLAIIAVGILWALAGCRGMQKIEDRDAALKARLQECSEQREKALRELRTAQDERDDLKGKLAEAQRAQAELAQLLGEQKALGEKREKEARELRELVKDLTGVTTESRPEGNFIVLESEILFALGKAELNERAKKSLDSISDYLKTKKGQEIRIDGHTDGVPVKFSKWGDNYRLAAERAHAVMSYLASRGIPQERMYIVGFGPNRPRVKPKKKTDSMAVNRRVELLLVPERGKGIESILERFE